MHVPVMVGEIMELLQVRPGGVYLDGTLGDGGHALAFLEKMMGRGQLVGVDRDRAALDAAAVRLAPWLRQCRLLHGNYSDMRQLTAEARVMEFDGILLDLGVSSRQLDEPQRGFSFRQAGPLDMRMDQGSEQSALDLLSDVTEPELREWLRRFGEEPVAGRIARAMLKARDQGSLRTTMDLAQVVERAAGGRRGRIHPATRTFQALRIAVNREIEHLQRGLEEGLRLLRRGGRMAVLAYHSLEDREVKQMIRRHT
ncbi:MAG: 16S rRNA (cytosine(1402)-N(4))-methyltransferase RsmH, partial [Lentisphaerae bacterium]|nr:16S rRNA (cytosine(1402)-N(4))-methyltransferase RsmH [Lentisphaerota bacterium]